MEQPIKILAVDDAEEFRQLYHTLLTENQQQQDRFTVETASSAEECIQKFYEFNPDVVILDVNLPEISGFDLCQHIRGLSDLDHYVGIIFVTAKSTPQLIASGLELGADDFCSKDHTVTELIARIQSVYRIKTMTDSLKAANHKLKAANEKLAKITITDHLTKLYNMRYFNKRFKQEFTRAARYQNRLSILMFDVDHFKQVNDSCDHLMGSFVLSRIGKIVAESIRSVDIAARFGGDEYVIALPETGVEGAFAIAKRIFDTIRGMEFDNGMFKLYVTISIGIATMGEGGKIFEEHVDLLREADKNLYHAKSLGRSMIYDGHTTSGDSGCV